MALALGGLFLSRSRRPSDGDPGRSSLPSRSPAEELGPEPESLAAQREAHESTGTVLEVGIRGKGIDGATRDPLPDCVVGLWFVGRSLKQTTTGTDGCFEFGRPVRPGSELLVLPADGWEIEEDSLELDGEPEDELLFVARAVPMDVVRGLVVDELDRTPVPHLRIGLEGEDLETDAGGEFVSSRRHGRGPLRVRLPGDSFEIGGWDPLSTERLIVPARLGPTVFLEIDAPPASLRAEWFPRGLDPAVPAVPLDHASSAGVQPGPPQLVHFARPGRPPFEGGELLLHSFPDRLFGRSPLQARQGTRDHPLAVDLEPCGFLQVSVRLSRALEWYEDVTLFLRAEGRAAPPVQSSIPSFTGNRAFLVIEPGPYSLEARFEELAVASAMVKIRLGEVQAVELSALLPDDAEQEAAEEPELPLHGRVTTSRGRPHPGNLRLTRLSDGAGELLELFWAKEDGQWRGRIEAAVPPGEYSAVLELEQPFPCVGPQRVLVPSDEVAVFTVDDSVPLIDVYFAPTAAEDGAPLLAFDAQASLPGGTWIGGGDHCDPALPAIAGHPATVAFSWACWAPDRRPVCGRWEPDGRVEDARIAVELERGWGVLVYVGDSDGLGLAGVRVLGDGVLLATSDASGHACIAGRRPGRLGFEFRGWVLDPANPGAVALDGSFEEEGGRVNAYLVPP
jgi:hypothetical protein